MLVVFPRNNHDAVDVRLNVMLLFNHTGNGIWNPIRGQYDCGRTAKLIGQYTKLATIPKIAKLLGWAEDNIALFSTCGSNSEECFQASNVTYDFGKPWVEPEKCVTPTEPI